MENPAILAGRGAILDGELHACGRMLSPQVGREESNLDGIERRDRCPHEQSSLVGVHQPDPDQYVEMGRPAQGAAAGCGGRKRSGPTGGCANGMPLKEIEPSPSSPSREPCLVSTMSPNFPHFESRCAPESNGNRRGLGAGPAEAASARAHRRREGRGGGYIGSALGETAGGGCGKMPPSGFVDSWRGRRVSRAAVTHLDVAVKERSRLDFMREVLGE